MWFLHVFRICIFSTVTTQQCLEEGASFHTSYKTPLGLQLPLHWLFPLMGTLPLKCI